MTRFLLLIVLLAGLATVTGCKSNPGGSREFIPGKGWVPTK